MADFTLYNYFRSSASHRVRIALNVKGIKYTYKAVHLLNGGGEQFRAEYKSLNPSREVPPLVHGDKKIAQSMAILDYLDAVSPEMRLFPKDAYERAFVLQACEIINSGTQPVHNLRVLQELEKRFGADQNAKNEWCMHWIHYGLSSLEQFLKDKAGRFCFGDEVTAADCCLIPQLYSADRFNVNLDSYPTLKRIRGECEKLESFMKAIPSAQPDAPPAA